MQPRDFVCWLQGYLAAIAPKDGDRLAPTDVAAIQAQLGKVQLALVPCWHNQPYLVTNTTGAGFDSQNPFRFT